ncbi:MAG: N-acetyltransferase [Microthrixaceae bacterium]
MEDLTTRPWEAADRPFLWDMLYLALYVRPGDDPLPRAVLNDPHIAHYLDGFGERSGDDAEVGLSSGQRVGAAWCRRLTSDDPGYGFVADDVPELGMAVVPERRGRGVGRLLLTQLLGRNPAMSLSVDNTNDAAVALYDSLGFVSVGEAGGSATMRRRPSAGGPPHR